MLTIIAEDRANHRDSCIVNITVLDANDNAPEITPKTKTVEIFENQVVGYSVFNFSATDADSGINKEFK